MPCPPGDLPNPDIGPASLIPPALVGEFFTSSTTWEALVKVTSYSQPFLSAGLASAGSTIIHPWLVDFADAKPQIHEAHRTVFWNLPFFFFPVTTMFLRFLHVVLWNKGH